MRFDIAAAYYHFSLTLPLYRGMPYNYETIQRYAMCKAAQLEAIRYNPGLSDSNLSTISPEAKQIYMNLVRKRLGVHSTNPKK